MKKDKRGISLIVLIITIILMIILASAVILSLNGGGLIEKARESVFKTRMKTYVEELNFSISNKVLDGTIAGTKSVNVKVSDSDYEEEIRELIGSIKKEDVGNIEVHDGILVYLVDSKDEGRYRSVDYLNSIGIIVKSKTGHCIGHHEWEEANYLNAKKCSICGLEDENYPKLTATAPHPDQTGTSTIGIGTDGQLVNLDLWTYSTQSTSSSVSAYNGTITDGRIQGCMPAVIANKPVTTLSNLFNGKSTLVYVPDLPSTVNNMYGTFFNCSNLIETPNVPSTVTNMQYTFYGCSKITKAPNVPEGVTNMQATFRGCSSLTETPNVPSTVINMQDTFYECSNLTETPNVPEGVANLVGTFTGCSNLTETPNVPSTVTDVQYAFFGCSKITKAPTIPEGITNMQYTFRGCSSLTETPNVPSTVTNMQGTFQFCSSLTETPNVPEGVTNMQDTFYGCGKMTNAPTIPEGITNMQYTFRGCSSLTGEVNILSPNVSNVSDCFYGITKSITLNVKADSTTYTTFNDAYGTSSLITIVAN